MTTKTHTHVAIGLTSRTIFNLPAWIAERRGYFVDAGLDVSLRLFDSGDASREALRSGAIQIAFSAPEGVLIDAYLRDGPLRVIGGNARRLPHFIIAQPRIKKLADLRGAKIGVISLREGTTFIVPTICRAAGLTEADYKILAVGGAPARWKLLQQGAIDAGLQPFPLSYQAESAGFNNLGWAGEFEPDWQFTAINADTRWTTAHREATERLLHAIRKGSDEMYRDPSSAAKIGAEELNAPIDLTLRSLEDNARLGVLDRALDWSEQGLARIFSILQQAGEIPIDETFNIARITDDSYLAASRRLD